MGISIVVRNFERKAEGLASFSTSFRSESASDASGEAYVCAKTFEIFKMFKSVLTMVTRSGLLTLSTNSV